MPTRLRYVNVDVKVRSRENYLCGVDKVWLR